MNIFSKMAMELRYLIMNYRLRRMAKQFQKAPALPDGLMTLHGLGNFSGQEPWAGTYDPSECAACGSKMIGRTIGLPRAQPDRPLSVAVGCLECANKGEAFEYPRGDKEKEAEATAKAEASWSALS